MKCMATMLKQCTLLTLDTHSHTMAVFRWPRVFLELSHSPPLPFPFLKSKLSLSLRSLSLYSFFFYVPITHLLAHGINYFACSDVLYNPKFHLPSR